MWSQKLGTYEFHAVWMRYSEYRDKGRDGEKLYAKVVPNRTTKKWELQAAGLTFPLNASLDEHMHYVLHDVNSVMVDGAVFDGVWLRAGEC